MKKNLLFSRKVRALLEEFAWEATLEKLNWFQKLPREQLVKYDRCDTSFCLVSCLCGTTI